MRKCKKNRGWGSGRGGGSDRGRGQGGCERRVEVIVKMQKKVGEGVRVQWGRGLVGGWDWSVGGGWLVARLGIGSDVGYGGCEPRIEGIVQCTKWYCTILRIIKKSGGWGWGGAIFELKTLSSYLKKRLTETGFEPTTSGLENLPSYPLG